MVLQGVRYIEGKYNQLDVTGSIFGATLISGGTLNMNIISGTFDAITSNKGISGLNVYATGSVVTQMKTVAKNITTTGSDIAGRIIESANNGPVFTVGVGSPITYGAFIQAGSTITSAGSLAVVNFGKGWTVAGNYYITFGNIAGSDVAFVSGTKRASGCTIVGAPSQTYDWVAVGF